MPKQAVMVPIEAGKRCAVDEFGFYITSEDQQPAPATSVMEAELERHGAFWVLATSQHIAIRLTAERRVDDTPCGDSGGSGGDPPPDVSHGASEVLPTLATPPRSQQHSPASSPALGRSFCAVDPHLEAASASLARKSQLESPQQRARQQQSATARVAAALMRKMRRRLRKHGGLPQPLLRRLVWPFFCGVDLTGGGAPSGGPSTTARTMLYNQLVHTEVNTEQHDVILRDLGRTFPTHCLYGDVDSIGQRTLHRVLQAYSAFDPDVGYCQGMGFLVAVLTLHLEEEDAFWVLVQMMHGAQFMMRQLFLPGFPLLQQFFVIFRQLSKRLLPRLSAHMEAEGVDVSFFAAQWFMTLFAYQFPIAMTSRIWDLFFSEGWKFIFKVSLALLQWDEPLLLNMRMEGMLMQLKLAHEGKSATELMRRALDVPVRERDLAMFAEARHAADDET